MADEASVPTRATPRQATSAVAHVSSPPEDDDPLLAFEPYLHKEPRSNSITPDRQRRFVATLAATGIVKQAAKSIGKSLEALYKLRHRPGAEGFAAAWDAALERGVQRLEDCALERAVQGTSTPIVSGGEILGWWDKPDNALLRFLLRYRLPQKYGPTAEDIGPGHPVYDELLEQARRELADHKRQLSAQVTARAMAIHTWRRRKHWRQSQAHGADAGSAQDWWDNDDADGFPQLPGVGGLDDGAREMAEQYLQDLEDNPPR
ncbi:hypothetical protein [Pontixanthobacter sp. CEM42]|uniref:hypothetical protein n=1 Tax=Pontixanthobacter sp. CEM42 TaxID=2792077 RepID=UPI001FD785BD|nr:hypothetical protein [Pontixanthobacter sp. CEM42]